MPEKAEKKKKRLGRCEKQKTQPDKAGDTTGKKTDG